MAGHEDAMTRQRLAGLGVTEREAEVLAAVAERLRNREIAASVHPHLSGQRRDRSVVALADLTPPAQRLLERANIWRLGTLTTATIDT
jgi:FixJ family two-component response regulator